MEGWVWWRYQDVTEEGGGEMSAFISWGRGKAALVGRGGEYRGRSSRAR